MVKSPPIFAACAVLALTTISAGAKIVQMPLAFEEHGRLDIVQTGAIFEIVPRPSPPAKVAHPGGQIAVGSSIHIDAHIARTIARNAGGTQ